MKSHSERSSLDSFRIVCFYIFPFIRLQSTKSAALGMGIAAGWREVQLHGAVSTRLVRNRSERARNKLVLSSDIAGAAARIQGQFIAVRRVRLAGGECLRCRAKGFDNIHVQKRHRNEETRCRRYVMILIDPVIECGKLIRAMHLGR